MVPNPGECDNQYPLSTPVQNVSIATRCLHSPVSSLGSSPESSPGSSSESLPQYDEYDSEVESCDSDSSSDFLDLDQTIVRHQEALLLQPGDHSDPARDSDFFTLLSALAEASNQDESDVLADLHEANMLHSHKRLGSALHERFHFSNNLTDLDEAVSHYREALNLVPAPHHDRWNVLSHLAKKLMCRFGQTVHLPDVEEAISMNRYALDLLPPQHRKRSSTLNALATALSKLFQESDQLPAVDEAVLLFRESLTLPQSNRSITLTNLAACLQSRFKRSSQQTDLEEAFSLAYEALDLLSRADAKRSFPLNTLSQGLLIQFEQSGQISDLDNAVSLQRESLVLSQEELENPYRPFSLTGLAGALHMRYIHTAKDQCTDLDEAILLFREALILQPPSPYYRLPVLNNLAAVLCNRYHHDGQVSFLNEAISLSREVLEQLPRSHPRRSTVLNTLSRALIELYNHSHHLSDLDESIRHQREALDLMGAQHPGRFRFLNNLSRALHKRFFHSHKLKDLREAITTCRESLQMLSPTHPDTCTISGFLGDLLEVKFRHTQRSDDLRHAADAFCIAVRCESAPVSQRFFAAQRWAKCADTNNHESAMEAYVYAIGFLPRLAFGLDLQSRQHVLTSGTDGLARDAAACAIRSGQFDLAVELLEEGRAVFWSQVLQLRDPLSRLTSEAPELAKKIKDISDAIEQGSLRNVSRNIADTPDVALAAEIEATNLRRLNEQWLAELDAVRQLSGFENFLRAKGLATLRAAAANGPVVILNASESGCGALILKSAEAGVLFVPLTHFTLDTAKELVDSMKKLANAAHPKTHGEEGRSMRRLPIAGDDEDIFRSVLASLWELVVNPILCSLNLKKSTSPLRLWWCPTGPFASLPIHAAGVYHAEGSESVSDFVISSYIPTLSTLLAPTSPVVDSFKMLVIVQPTGQDPLPYTREELRKIEEHMQAECLIKYGTAAAPALINNILLDFPAASIVHLACHGQQNSNPLDSALVLEDGQLKVAQLMQLSLTKASLVYLSACETAMGDEKLPDEVIHLAAALLFVGFRGAIGTMWSIRDSDGPKVADAFYGHISSLSTSAMADTPVGPDTTHAARALHIAVAKLRAQPNCSFRRWVPFIHLGF